MATIQQIPGELNLALVRGDEWSWSVRVVANLTGYTLSTGVYDASIATANPANVTAPTFTTSIATVAGVTKTTVVCTLTEAQTALLEPNGNYRWFLRWVSPGSVTRTIVAGNVDVRLP